MKTVVIVVAVLAIIAIAVILLRQGHPEQTSGHVDDPVGESSSDRLYHPDDRPAGADVEDQSIGDPRIGRRSQPGASDDVPPDAPGQ